MHTQQQRLALLITARQSYRDARRSAQQREQQLIEVQHHIIDLQANHGDDQGSLAAARTEQSARVRLAAQANRNVAVAMAPLLDIASIA